MSAVSNQLRRAGAIFGTALFLLAAAPLGQADHNTAPDFKIREGKNGRLPKLNTSLPRYVQVFGLFIHATSRVPEAKLLHAADIAAETERASAAEEGLQSSIDDATSGSLQAALRAYCLQNAGDHYVEHGDYIYRTLDVDGADRHHWDLRVDRLVELRIGGRGPGAQRAVRLHAEFLDLLRLCWCMNRLRCVRPVQATGEQ